MTQAFLSKNNYDFCREPTKIKHSKMIADTMDAIQGKKNKSEHLE